MVEHRLKKTNPNMVNLNKQICSSLHGKKIVIGSAEKKYSCGPKRGEP